LPQQLLDLLLLLLLLLALELLQRQCRASREG
jgi:hypothetical protein